MEGEASMVAGVTADSPEFNNKTTTMENELMCSRDTEVKTLRSSPGKLVALALFSALVTVYAHPALAQASTSKTFSSVGEAAHALFQAVQNGDEQQLGAILGAGKDVTSSGDELEDKLEREQFTKKYQEMHRLVREADGSTMLYIGAENWPFPVPLLRSNGVWHFDSDAGRREILFRAIGENESIAIEVCDAFAATSKKGGSSKTGNDPIGDLAEKLFLRGAKDAADAGPANETFHGYYFQTKKVAGHAGLIAYPAKYRSSGVMTFVVTEDGVVFQKDLGPNATTVASTINVRKLDSSWQTAE